MRGVELACIVTAAELWPGGVTGAWALLPVQHYHRDASVSIGLRQIGFDEISL